MQVIRFHRAKNFRVLAGTPRAQVAEMVIAPGKSEGGPDNRHPRSDQWLLVTAGTGQAIVEGKRIPLREGTLLLIEKGERHEIRNTARHTLRSLNFYSPPAY